MSGAELISAERERQKAAEGWSAAHDDLHGAGELTIAAISYAVFGLEDCTGSKRRWARFAWDQWPWEPAWWKPSDDRERNLVKAGALIAAEIDRLQRLREDRIVHTPGHIDCPGCQHNRGPVPVA